MLDGLYVSVIGDGGEGPYEAGLERAQYSPEPPSPITDIIFFYPTILIPKNQILTFAPDI